MNDLYCGVQNIPKFFSESPYWSRLTS